MLSRWLIFSNQARQIAWGMGYVRREKDALPYLRCLFNNLSCGAASSLSPNTPSSSLPPSPSIFLVLSRAICVSSSDQNAGATSASHSFRGEKEPISLAEAKKLMRLANVESLKTKLGLEGKEVIGYKELLDECQEMGLARNLDEAVAFAQVLDEAGVVLLFRDKVYLHPDKVVDLVRRAVPIALTHEDDPLREELNALQEKKEEIDVKAHKQVRCILWFGLAFSVAQVVLFFRLTFWEFSWDVMEPIAFFTTATGVVIGYAYFLYTSRDPSYQDLLKRMFLSRQRKLIKKLNFDVDRFVELQKKCNCTHHACTSIKKRVGVDLDLEDALHSK